MYKILLFLLIPLICFSQYGNNQITNGTFADATGWTLNGTAAISGGTLQLTGDGTTGNIATFTIPAYTTADSVYWSYDIVAETLKTKVNAFYSNFYNFDGGFAIPTANLDVGSHTLRLNFLSSNTLFRIRTLSAADSGIVYFDNFVVRQKLDTLFIDPLKGDDTASGADRANAIKTYAQAMLRGTYAGGVFAQRTGTTTREQLTVGGSGTAGNPITFTKYDSTGESGADPFISGADLVSGFGVDAISSLAASEVSGATTGEGLRKFSATTYLGQGFNIANVGTFDSCVVWVEKNGTPTGNMWAEIWDISAGKPNAIIANGVSDSVDVSTIANPHEWIQLIFNDSPTASVGDYALVLRGDYAGDATDFIEWGVNYAGTYLTQAEPYCKFLDNDGASWASETARDHNFKIYVALPVWSVALTTEPNRIFFDGRSAPTTDWSWAANKLYILTDDTVNVEVTQRNICIDLDDESYITIDGIHITKSNRHGIENATSSSTTVTNNIIQNCTIDLCGWSGIESGNDSNDLGNNFTVQYCVIDSNGILLNNHHGIYINYGKNWVVQYNSFTGNIGYGVQIQNNADSNIVRYNTTTGNISGGFVIFDDGGGGCNDNQIYYNISNGDRDGIQVGGTADNATNLIYNNVFYGFTQYGLRVDGDPTLVTVKNNIFWSSESGAEIFHDEDGAADMTSDYNILGPESSNFIQWRGTQYSTLATFVSGESQDANSLNVDPLFTSATDFTLQSTSPAINAGVSVGLVLDYAGNTVPFETLPDIGAYEYQLSTSTGYEIRFPRFKDFTKFPRR